MYYINWENISLNVANQMKIEKVMNEFKMLHSDVPEFTHVESLYYRHGGQSANEAEVLQERQAKAEIIEFYVKKMFKFKEGIIVRTNSRYCSLVILGRKQNRKPADLLEAWKLVIEL